MTFADHLREAFRRVQCEEKLIENVIENMCQDRKARIYTRVLLNREKDSENTDHSIKLIGLWEEAKKMLIVLTSAK